jgi:HEAT repeat protein
MDPAEAVQLFRLKERRIDAMRALAGAVNASDLRRLSVPDEVRNALIAGAADPYPSVRFWCLQLLDHLPDPAVLPAVCRALDDAVPRVRRLAAHALGCGMCKPTWDGALPPEAVTELAELASDDVNKKVREEASFALTCSSRRVPGHEPAASR